MLATFTVNSVLDTVDAAPGDGVAADSEGRTTLRTAIMECNALPGADTILLSEGTYFLGRNGAFEDASATGDLDVTSEIAIIGDGNGATISARDMYDRIMDVRPGGTLTISQVTFREGGPNEGAGIRCYEGTLVMTDCIVTNCEVWNFVEGSEGGGVRVVNGQVTLNRCAIVSNKAPRFGGGISLAGTVRGTITNTTISGNRSINYRGAVAFYDPSSASAITFTNCTIANNRAGYGSAGVYAAGGGLRFLNCIVAQNVLDQPYYPEMLGDITGNVESLGGNFIGKVYNESGLPEGDGFTDGVHGDRVGTTAVPLDPRLGPLANHGGWTPTQLPLAGSPVIDAGINSGAPTSDQRGIARPLDGDGNGTAIPDIGAVEVDAVYSMPWINNVSSPLGDGAYPAATVIPVTVAFSQTVTVTGAPELALETGSVARVATYVGGSGTDTLTFRYTVQPGDTAADLDYLSASALALNGGTIRSTGGENAELTLPAPRAAGSLGANKSIVVDTTAPTTTLTSPASGATYGNASWMDAIAGTATDSGGAGISQVEVSIRCGTGNYWDGTGFNSGQEVLLTASGTSTWSFQFAHSNFSADGQYTIHAQSTDLVGNVESGSTTTFTYVDLYGADLAINGWDIVFDPPNPDPGQPVTIRATIANLGAADAANVAVLFSDFDASVGQSTIASLPAGMTCTVSVNTTFDTQSLRLITVRVDPDNTLPEANETNNEAAAVLQVGTPLESAQITVTVSSQTVHEGWGASICGVAYYDFLMTPETMDFPVQGARVTVTVVDPVTSVVLGVYTGAKTDAFGNFSQGIIVPVDTDDEPDSYTLLVQLTDETLTGQGQASLQVLEDPAPPIPPSPPVPSSRDVAVYSDWVSFSENNPSLGEPMTLCAYLWYCGQEAAPHVPVSIYDVFPVGGRSQEFLIGSTVVDFPANASGGFVTLILPWIPTADGTHVIQVKVSPAFSQPGANDTATRSIVVGEMPLPLRFDKTVDLAADADGNGLYSPGDTITYTLCYSNLGSTELTDCVVLDKLDDELLETPLEISNGGTFRDATIVWNLGTLAAGTSGVLTCSVAIKPASQIPDGTANLTNTAFLDTQQTPPWAATASITVVDVNDAPSGTDSTVSVEEDHVYTFTADDFGFTDPHDNPPNAFLNVSIRTLPEAGTLALGGENVAQGQSVGVSDIQAARLTYTPPRDANGKGYASFTFQVRDDGGTVLGGVELDPVPNTLTIDVTAVPDVTGRYLFYNNSFFDGDSASADERDYSAIAPAPAICGHGHAGDLNEPDKELGKQALLPGQAANLVNYSSYSKGINGIILVFDDLGSRATLTAADFVFRVGNDNSLAGWSEAPAPAAVRVEQNVSHANFSGQPDVVRITWADENPYTPTREAGAISNQWLQVTVLANARTGLAANDVFYFGNQIGESGNSATDTSVDQNDEIGARNHPHTAFSPATISDPYDFDRDGKVDQNDEILARNNPASAFTRISLITVPGAAPVNAPPVNLLPSAMTTSMNTPLSFSISIADPDAGAGQLSVNLLVSHGKVDNLTSVTMEGDLAMLNNMLASLQFTPDAGFMGAATITVTTNDHGNTGVGGAQIDIDVLTIFVGSPLLAADSGESDPSAAALAQADLGLAVQAALTRWQAAGLSASMQQVLAGANYVVSDLPGNVLGLAAGQTVYLDRDAAGRGWFIDPTPAGDEEFGLAVGPAAGKIDLLTAVMHEMGHVLGRQDVDAATEDLMSGLLTPGTRRTWSAKVSLIHDAVFGNVKGDAAW